jgi:uncharacterized membrane protein YebE (DUF533 family)
MKKLAFITVASLAMTACVTTDPYTGQQKASNTAIGTGIGAAAGALGGLIVGEATGADTRKSVLLGAGIGALTGGGIGLYMDQQEAELRAQLQGSGISVTRHRPGCHQAGILQSAEFRQPGFEEIQPHPCRCLWPHRQRRFGRI